MKRASILAAFIAAPVIANAFDINECEASGTDPNTCLSYAAKIFAGKFGPLSADMCAAYEDPEARLFCYDDFVRNDRNIFYALREEFDWRNDTMKDFLKD